MKPLPDRIYKFGWPHFRSWSAKKHLATHYGPTVFGPDSVSYQKGWFSWWPPDQGSKDQNRLVQDQTVWSGPRTNSDQDEKIWETCWKQFQSVLPELSLAVRGSLIWWPNNPREYRGSKIRSKPRKQWQERIQHLFPWTWLRMWKTHWVLLVSFYFNWPLMTYWTWPWQTDFSSDLDIGILSSFLTILICNHVDSVDYWSWVGSRVHSWRVAVECISCVG